MALDLPDILVRDLRNKYIPDIDLGLVQHVQQHIKRAVKLAEMIGYFHNSPTVIGTGPKGR